MRRLRDPFRSRARQGSRTHWRLNTTAVLGVVCVAQLAGCTAPGDPITAPDVTPPATTAPATTPPATTAAASPLPATTAAATPLPATTAAASPLPATTAAATPETAATQPATAAELSRARRSVASKRLLQAQQSAVASGDRRRYLATWDAASAISLRRARTTYASLEKLRLGDLSARYLPGTVQQAPTSRRETPDTGVWTADVHVAWRLARFDAADAHTTLRYSFGQRGGRAHIVDIEAAEGSRQPIWLAGSLSVRRTAHTLAVASNAADAATLSTRLRVAYREVRHVMGRSTDGLVGYWPGSTTDFESLIGATPGSYDAIAAVTTTVDGSLGRHAPVAVMVNPDVFERLRPRGRHVVLTHEATHALTPAGASEMPVWLAEGFADYVGIGAVEVALRVSAGAAVRQVRRNGLPSALPSDADFAASAPHLESTYEQAWLAVRLLSRRYGERRLVAFYDAVAAHPHRLDHALQAELGTTRSELTARWRVYLDGVADGS